MEQLITAARGIRRMTRNVRSLTWGRIDFLMSVHSLRKLESESGIEPYEIPFKFKGYGEYRSIAPKQVPEEIAVLFRLVQSMHPKYICEIGTLRGGTLYMWCRAANQKATLISIDLPGSLYYTENRIKFYRQFGSDNQRLVFLASDSHLSETVAKVKAELEGNALDFLFIDGDHTYEGVKADFEMYSPLVRPGGVIALHDIMPRPGDPTIEVYRLWGELKQSYEHEEIIRSRDGYPDLGIGVIWLP